MSQRQPASRPSRRRLWRILGGLAALLLLTVGGCTWHIVSAFLPSDPITISPETTVLTGPLTSEGLVDYAAALNDAGAARVPSDRNAAALLIRAFGPLSIGPAGRFELLQRLDAVDLPERGQYLVSRSMFDERLAADPIVHGPSGQAMTALDNNRVNHSSRYPWTRSGGEEMAAWIDANEVPLEIVVEAAGRPECYLPIREGTELLSLNLSPLDFPVREAALLLQLRANLKIGEQDYNGARNDARALRQLARHLETSEFVMTRLFADGLSGSAALTSGRLAYWSPPDARRCREMLAELQEFGPPRSIESVIDVGERYEMLDSLQRLALQARRSRAATVTVMDVPTGHVDWDEVLRGANSHFDRLRSAAALPDYSGRLASLDAIGAEVTANRGPVDRAQLRLYRDAVFYPRGRATRTFSDYMIVFLGRGYSDFVNSHTRAVARYRLALVATAIGVYRSERFAYPATLGGLVPEYLDAVPLDPFTDDAFIYKVGTDGDYLLYSVGENLHDENGATFGEEPRGDDLPLR